eukprot:6177701-Pleurochrysis_carterae.AAC.2
MASDRNFSLDARCFSTVVKLASLRCCFQRKMSGKERSSNPYEQFAKDRQKPSNPKDTPDTFGSFGILIYCLRELRKYPPEDLRAVKPLGDWHLSGQFSPAMQRSLVPPKATRCLIRVFRGTLLNHARLAWRAPASLILTGICLEQPSGTGGEMVVDIRYQLLMVGKRAQARG